jgi:uncharacterized protein (DUF2147 family)
MASIRVAKTRRHREPLLCIALVLCAIGGVRAQGASPAAKPPAVAADKTDLDVLKGAWVRPDGGYVIVIKSVGAGGELDAMYYNPNPLPFAKAQARRDGQLLRADFELRAGGYAGSTYTLGYDSAKDQLKGIYYQAVAKQTFEVIFVRK